MSTVHRLKLVGAVLGLAILITCSHVWGDSSSKREPLMSKGRTDVPELKLGEGLAAGKFAQQSIVAYRTTKGELLFGAQIQPKLDAVAPQPRDIVVLIDNSASQAGVPYNEARRITAALNDTLGKQDQLSIWVVSTPSFTKCLSKDAGTDFQAPKAAKITSALDKLEKEEYCAGATDLKNALKSAMASFDIRSNRQPVILLLGDGESVSFKALVMRRASLYGTPAWLAELSMRTAMSRGRGAAASSFGWICAPKRSSPWVVR